MTILALLLALSASEPDRDDPRARQEAKQLLHEETPSTQALTKRLLAARRERDRAGAAVRMTAAAAPQGVWTNVGPSRADQEFNGAPYLAIDSGRVRAILPHPWDPGILYVATAGGGVWKTWDATDALSGGTAASWEAITDRSVGSLSVGALAMDPQDPDVLVLGLGDPFDNPQPGLLRSTDGGATFSDPVFPAGARSTRDVAVDPQDSANILVATDAGLFRWDGAGQPVYVALPEAKYEAWSIAWAGPGTWLVTTVNDQTGFGNLWRSSDGGLTWASVLGGFSGHGAEDLGRMTLAAAKATTADPSWSRLYLLAADMQGGSQRDVYRSDDGGRTWLGLGVNATHQPLNPDGDQQNLDVMHEQAFYNQAIAVDPGDPNVVYVGGNLAMVRTLDGGMTWSVLTDWLPAGTGIQLPYVHADFHVLSFSTAGAKVLFAGSDGGVFASTDSASASPHFTYALNDGIASHLAYSVACAQPGWPASQAGFLIGGMQDNGTRLRTSGSTFDQVIGGDGIGVAVGSTATDSGPDVVLASVEFNVLRSTGGGAPGSWQLFRQGLSSGQLPFFVRFAHDSADAAPDTFLTFTWPPNPSVFRSSGGGAWVDLGQSIATLDGTPLDGFVNAGGAPAMFHRLATHPTVPGIYAVSGTGGSIFTTVDGGRTWVRASVLGTNASRPDWGIFSAEQIAFDPADATGSSFWVVSDASVIIDLTSNPQNPATQPVPATYGHVFHTSDRGATWSSVLGSAANPLPDAGAVTVAIDAGNLLIGTQVGLYRSTNGGADFVRDPGLPLVEVEDICSSGNGKIDVATYGRGFWELNLAAGGAAAGVKGNGDLNYDQRLDAFDLVDLAAAIGTTNTDAAYRPAADLVGATNAVDDADLDALVARLGGTP